MSDVLAFIAGAARATVEPFEIGGGVVYLRGMTSVHRASFNQLVSQAIAENSDVPDHVIVAWGLCDADGNRPNAKPEEILEKLEGLDGKVLKRMATRILEMSGYGRGSVEAAEKN